VNPGPSSWAKRADTPSISAAKTDSMQNRNFISASLPILVLDFVSVALGIRGDGSRKHRRVSSYNKHQENAPVIHGLYRPAADLGLTGKTNFSTLGRRSPPVSKGGLTMIFSRKAIAKSVQRVVLAGISFALLLGHLPEVFAQGPVAETSAPLILRSTLENLSRGFIPAGLPPALRIKSGQIVQIETFSHHGFVDDPV